MVTIFDLICSQMRLFLLSFWYLDSIYFYHQHSYS
uniref:Uncharacterized protein n=1 Tax=Setaria italica TaxID=4555 RepID=K3Z124_SETIT